MSATGWMRRHKVWTGVLVAVVALGLIGAFASGEEESGGSPSSSAAESESSNHAVRGRVAGRFDRDCLLCDERLASRISVSDVWCGWRDEKVIVHVRMRNDSVEHVTVNWHPSYVIEGGSEHGAGLSAVQSDGFDAGEVRVLEAEQDPQGTQRGSPIAECKPSFSVIEAG